MTAADEEVRSNRLLRAKLDPPQQTLFVHETEASGAVAGGDERVRLLDLPRTADAAVKRLAYLVRIVRTVSYKRISNHTWNNRSWQWSAGPPQ